MTAQPVVRFSTSTLQPPTPPPASPGRHALVDRLAERILALAPARLRVAIDGPTAAGKTSLGHELAEHLVRAGRPVLRACLDDFKRPWKDRHRYDRESGEGYYRNAYDYDAVTRLLLEPAAPGGTGRCVLCSIDPLTQKDHSDVVTPAPPDAVLVVDGVFAFRPEIDRHWDFRIWLDIAPELSVRRGAARDASWAGADATALHRHRYLPSMECYESEVRPQRLADVVVDNTDFTRPRVVRESR
ncbi:uridine kinase [Saccharomonospora azurea]|uniref:uridine kinase n=1 Tax=Saccharomonospora azurea TaxID=40988 RepID=UPI0005673DDD|nr:uridine kinase [Saccharomonospora azurea]